MFSVSTSDFDNLLPFNIYPNPSSNLLRFENLIGAYKFELFDITGKLALSGKINNIENDFEFSIENLNSGTYILVLEYGNSKYLSKKIIKQ